MPTCNLTALPVAGVQEYCDPTYNFGGFCDILIGAQPFADITDLAEHTTRIDNTTGADATKIRRFYIIGDKPAGSTNELVTSGRRRAYAPKIQTINFTVDAYDNDDREFFREIENKGGFQALVWPATEDWRFGGNEGFNGTITVDEIIPSGEQDLHTIVGTVTYKGDMGTRTVNQIP